MRTLLLGGVVAVGAFAGAAEGKVVVSSKEGIVELNGSPHADEELDAFDVLRVRVDGSTASSGATLSPVAAGAEADNQRLILRFNATGDVDDVTYRLPADATGETNESAAGTRVIFGTWNPDVFPNAHAFRAEAESAGGEGSVDVEIRQAPNPEASRTAGTFVTDALDNGPYDQDPAVGSIVLNRALTPTINLGVTLPEYTFNRAGVTWDDDVVTGSTNIDEVFSNAWAVFDDGTDGHDPIFDSAVNGLSQFDVDEIGNRIVTGADGVIDIDLTTVADGVYTLKLWSIPWHSAGFGEELGFGSSGTVDQEFLLQVQVVPEPAGVVCGTIALAFAALRRQRR